MVGADIDRLLARSQQADELDLVLEPVCLLAQHLGREQIERIGHDDADAFDHPQNDLLRRLDRIQLAKPESITVALLLRDSSSR